MADTQQLITTLADQATPIAPARPLTLSFAWAAGSLFYIIALLFFFGLREDLGSQLQHPLFAAEISTLAWLALAAAMSAALLSFPDQYQKQTLLWLPVIPALVFLAVLYMAWLNDNPPAPTPAHGFECLLCIVCFSSFPAAWMFYQLRRQAGIHYYISGAVSLLAACGMGCLALRLSEPVDSISHLIMWHYLPMLGFAMLGLWLGKTFLKW